VYAIQFSLQRTVGRGALPTRCCSRAQSFGSKREAPGILSVADKFLLPNSGQVGGLSTFYSLTRYARPST
jgi:hypothetical protein